MKWVCLLWGMLGLLPLTYGQEAKYGTLSGSLETNTVFYLKDSKLGDVLPADHFGSNNYARLDYAIRQFRAGLQYEAYLPVLQGYPAGLKESDLVFKYVTFEDFNLSVTAGDFYEQYGSGLVFRAYEERALGFNTSVEGLRGEYIFGKYARIKGMWGRPRKFMEHAESKIRGADLSFSLASVFGWQKGELNVEGSYVNRYEAYTGPEQRLDPNVEAWSARISCGWGGWTLRGEYVTKSKDMADYNFFSDRKGNALLGELGYSSKGFGMLLMFRQLDNMRFAIEREVNVEGVEMNYVPALTRQYTYMLQTLNPYTAQVNGEMGGQADLYYNFRKGTALGGKYGTKVAVNFSIWYNLRQNAQGENEFGWGKTLMFRDFSIDLIKTWTADFKSVIQYSLQTFNPLVTGHESARWVSHIAVADLTYRLTAKKSLRLELQHLFTDKDQKNWMAALLEFNMAPSWSLYAQDMYNYGDTDIHYYYGGVSYARSRTRIALNYGRNRGGYTCAGGVCRQTPAYTGFNLQLTMSF